MLKSSIGLAVAMCAFTVMADSNSLNLQIPTGQSSFQSDSIRAGDLDCSNAIGGATNLELGVTGIINNATGPFSSGDSANPQTKDVGVYARITIPLDGPSERINCNTLYQLELRKKRLELERLQQEINNLKALKGFEN